MAEEILIGVLKVDYNQAINSAEDYLKVNEEINLQQLRLKEEAKELRKEFQKTFNDTDVEKARENQARLNKQLAANKAELRELGKAQRSVNKEFDAVQKGLGTYEKLKKRLSDVKKEMKNLAAEGKKVPKEMAAEFRKLNSQIKRSDQAVNRNVGAYRKLTTRLTIVKKRMKDLLADGRRVPIRLAQEFRKLNAQVRDTEKAVGESQREVGGYRDAINGFATEVAAIAATVYVFANAIQSSLEAVDKQQKAEASLLTALSGREKIQARLIEQAGETQNNTLFGDEEIIAQQSYLVALGRTEEEINKILDAAVNLASGTDFTLDSAVKNLAKTTSGLSGELGEAIPQLRELTQEELKAGKGIDVVSKAFAGQAAAAAKAGTGPLRQLANRFGDLNEKVGNIVNKIINGFAPAIDKTIQLFDFFLDKLGGADNGVQTLSESLTLSQAAFNNEIETLKRGSLSKENYSKLVDEINTRYAEYLPNLLTEKSSLEEITKAQNAANKAFENKITLLATEEALVGNQKARLDAKKRELELQRTLTEQEERQRKIGEEAQKRRGNDPIGRGGTFQNLGLEKTRRDIRENAELQKELEDQFNETLKAAQELGLDIDKILGDDAPIGGGGKTDNALTGLTLLRDRLSKLTKSLDDATTDDIRKTIIPQIIQLEKEISAIEARQERLRSEALGGNVEFDELGTVGSISVIVDNVDNEDLKEVKKTFDQVALTRKSQDEIDLKRRQANEKALAKTREAARKSFQEIIKKDRAKEIKDAKTEEQRKKQAQERAFEFASNLNARLASIANARIERTEQRELASLNSEFEARLDAARGNAELTRKLQEERARREKEIAEDAAKERKRIAIIEAGIELAISVIKAASNPIQAAAVGILGLAQIAAIQAAQFKGGTVFDKGPKHGENGSPGIPIFNRRTKAHMGFVERDEALLTAGTTKTKKHLGVTSYWNQLNGGDFLGGTLPSKELRELLAREVGMSSSLRSAPPPRSANYDRINQMNTSRDLRHTIEVVAGGETNKEIDYDKLAAALSNVNVSAELNPISLNESIKQLAAIEKLGE